MKFMQALAFVFIGIAAAVALSLVISPDIAIFAGFLIAIGGVIYSDRKQVKLEGIVIIRRTKKGRNFIDRIANRSPGMWRAAANFGVALAVVLMIGGSALLLVQAAAVTAGAQDGGVKLLLPGPVDAPVNAPGVFLVPWWIWVIGIAVVIIPHEFMHGVMCRIDKVRIKSVGWILLAVIPGAFVEPDEKQLKKSSKMTKLRVYAAGSFANMVMAAIIIVIFITLLASAFTPAGLLVGTVENGAAHNASLNGSIVSINGQQIRSQDDLSGTLAQYFPGDVVMVEVAKTERVVPTFRADESFFIPKPVGIVSGETETIRIVLEEHPDRSNAAYLGVIPIATAATLNMDVNTYATIATLLLWMFIFSFGIGLVNLLPIKPLDGGLFFEELVGGRKRLVHVVSAAMVALLVFNIIGPLFV